MDPSLKEYRIVQEGVDLFVEMGVDWKAISDEYIGELRNITPIEYYRERVEKQIAQTHSGQSLDTLKRIISLQTRQFDFLPNTLPYAVIEVLDRFDQIPTELRHRVRLQIPSVLDQTLSLPEISGRRITLTFSGATADDQAVIDQYGGIFKVPPYLVRVIPILRVNGNKVAEGTSMETAISSSFTIDYTPPGGEVERFDHHILAGSFNAIGITTGKVRPEFLTIAQVEESEESYLPKMLHSLVMKYHHQINQSRELLKETMRMQSRTFIIESLVSTFQQRQTILGGIPIRFEFTGFTIDAKEMLSASIPVDGKNLGKKGIDFAMIHGHEASYQENRVFEESMFWMGGTSAIKGLQFLKAEGIPIIELTPHQIYANPNLPGVVLEDINNALNMGWNVTVPEQIGDLPAVPYIKYDAKTGSAGYMIATLAGGLAQEITPIGHETDLTFMRDLFQASQIRLTPAFIYPESPYSLPLGESVLVGFQVAADGPGQTHQVSSGALLFDTERTHYRPGRWPIYSVLPGEYKFKFDGRDLFVLNVWGPIIHSDSDRYLGISTENGVEVIKKPAHISYAISGPPTINLQTAALKVLDRAGSEIRTQSLPLSLGDGQIAEWDGKDNAGLIVPPGEYSTLIEANGDGGNTKSKVHKVIVANVEFNIRIRVFIPFDNIANSIFLDSIQVFEGDGVGFNRNGEFRARQDINVVSFSEINSTGEKEGTKRNLVGKTRIYDKATSLDASGKLTPEAKSDTILRDTTLKIDEADAENTGMNIIVLPRTSLHRIDIKFIGSVRNGLASYASGVWPSGVVPSADWEFTISIDSAQPLNPQYTISGLQDGFPAYEIYINDQQVYGELNADAGQCDSNRCPAARNLFDFLGDKTVGMSGFISSR